MMARPIGEILARRRTRQPVRRNSYDIEDRRADVFRPIGDGTIEDGLRWRDSLWRAVNEWNVQYRVAGKGVPLPGGCMRVLQAILFGNQLDFRTGRLEPSLDVLGRMAGCARDTVVSALTRLRELGIIDWVRRTMPTGAEPGEGPTVKQATNAYFFKLGNAPERLYKRFRELLERRRLRAAERRGQAHKPAQTLQQRLAEQFRSAAPGTAEHQTQRQLDSLDETLSRRESASPTSGQIPPSTKKGKRSEGA